MRTTPVALLLLVACGSAPPSPEPAAAEAPPALGPCDVMPPECEATFGWIDCDDCDTDELATRDRPAVLLICLEQALRCGPDDRRRARYAEHGREAQWSEHFRLRAVDGLASLGSSGTDALRRSRAWQLPPSAVGRVDQVLGGSPQLDPPAGGAPCAATPGVSTPVEAALACFRDRVQPALLELGPRDASYRFGRGEYLRTTYALAPAARVSPRQWPQVEAELRRHGPTLLQQITALGDPAAVVPGRSWVLVEIHLRSADMPDDGGAVLVFVVDAATRDTVFVYRQLHG